MSRDNTEITDVTKLKPGRHYVMLVQDSIAEDDGYDGFSQRAIVRYLQFDTQEALLTEVKERMISTYDRRNFRIMEVTPMEVQTTVVLRQPQGVVQS